MFKNYRLRDYDFKLIILVLALSAVGIMTIGSAEPAQQSRQMAGVAAGVVIMIALSFFNYSVILKLYWLMYIVNLVLLAEDRRTTVSTFRTCKNFIDFILCTVYYEI